MKTITLPVVLEYTCDVFVAGGGVAGFAAAVAAAREGASVILSEMGGYLGGTATKGLVGPFMTCYDKKGETQLIRGFFSEFVERMVADGGAVSYRECKGNDSYSGYRPYGHKAVTPFAQESFKRVSEALCVEAGVKLLYHTQVVACDTDGRRITCAYLVTADGVAAVHAEQFIDATGTAALAAAAGAETFRGDETGLVQTSSLFFQIDGVDKAALDGYMATHHETRARFFLDEIEEARQNGEFPCGTQKLRIFEAPEGLWYVNMAQEDAPVNELDPEAVTAAEISQRKQIPVIVAFLRKYVPGLQQVRLAATAAELGVRESRRIVGRTLFTGEELLKGIRFEDRIAVCANSMDMHQATKVAYTPYDQDTNYTIPLSCLIARDMDNLMAAGKCLSADKYAFAAVRVIPPSMAMGEAVGITAALAVKNGCDACCVPARDVQEKLLEKGAYLD